MIRTLGTIAVLCFVYWILGIHRDTAVLEVLLGTVIYLLIAIRNQLEKIEGRRLSKDRDDRT